MAALAPKMMRGWHQIGKELGFAHRSLLAARGNVQYAGQRIIAGKKKGR